MPLVSAATGLALPLSGVAAAVGVAGEVLCEPRFRPMTTTAAMMAMASAAPP